MASRSNRQRKMERARAERRAARLAEQTRRKRQIQAGIVVSLALVLIVAGTTWLLGGFDSKPADDTAAPDSCSWTAKDPAGSPSIVDTGSPPATGELRSGIETMVIKTNLGDIEALLDLSKAPCAAASFAFLGESKVYEGTKCHRLSAPSRTLTCGDPKSDGTGGPSYQFADEDLPSAPLPQDTTSPSPSASASPSPASATYYAKGTIVMVNTGANTNGSQFSIVYGDGSDLSPAYSIVGTVTKGLDIVDGIVAGGAVDDKGAASPEGKPSKDLIIQQLYVGTPPETAPPVSPSVSPTAQS